MAVIASATTAAEKREHSETAEKGGGGLGNDITVESEIIYTECATRSRGRKTIKAKFNRRGDILKASSCEGDGSPGGRRSSDVRSETVDA